MRTRHALLASLEDHATTAPHGAIVLIGDPGTGKSRILLDLESRIPRAQLARINPGDTDWPLSGISTILAALDAPRASDFIAQSATQTDTPAALAALAGSLISLLRDLDLPATVLLVDDVDRMDAASRRVLGHLAGHLGATRIHLIATASELADHEPLAGLPAVRIDPLSLEGLSMLAPPGLDPGTLRILAHVSDGNPGVFRSVARTLTSEQTLGRAALTLPIRTGAIGAALAERVRHQLTPEHSDLVERLSTAPLHLRSSIRHWGPDYDDLLQDLLDRSLAGERGSHVTIPNPLLRVALGAELTPARRRALHAELRDVADPLLRAWHDSWIDPHAEVRHELLASAAELACRGFVHSSVELAERALRTGVADTANDLAAIANGLLNSGELHLAERYLQMATRDSGADASARLNVATQRLRVDYVSGTGIRPALVDIDSAAPEAQAQWRATFAAVSAARGEFSAARGTIEHLTDLPENVSTATRSAASAASALTDAARSARPQHDIFDETDPLMLALHAQADILAQNYPRARRAIDRLASVIVRETPMWSGWLTSLAVDCNLRAGNIGAALETARQWSLHGHLTSGPAGFVPLDVWALVAHDKVADAETALAVWTADAPARVGPLPAATGLLFHAELAVLRGDDERSCELLLLADQVASPIADPSIARVGPPLVDALMAVGRVRAAQVAAHKLAASATRFPSRWATVAAARALATTAPIDRLLDAVNGALAGHEAGDSLFERGRLYLAAARRLAASGMTAEAERSAAEARMAFTGCGAHLWTRKAAALGATPASPRTAVTGPLATLTPDERAVAELVTRGMQNKEIAAELFVSLRTVELRLTRIYRKLGARSRAHLVALMS